MRAKYVCKQDQLGERVSNGKEKHNRPFVPIQTA